MVFLVLAVLLGIWVDCAVARVDIFFEVLCGVSCCVAVYVGAGLWLWVVDVWFMVGCCLVVVVWFTGGFAALTVIRHWFGL